MKIAPLVAIMFSISFIVMAGCDSKVTPSSPSPTPAPAAPTPTPAPAPTAEKGGKQLFFEKGCIGCHRINGEGGNIGPSLVGILGKPVELTTGESIKRDHEYFEQSILNPDSQVVKGYQPGIMPKGGVTHVELHQVEDFIRSLK